MCSSKSFKARPQHAIASADFGLDLIQRSYTSLMDTEGFTSTGTGAGGWLGGGSMGPTGS